jgi:RecA/RadA recombinase
MTKFNPNVHKVPTCSPVLNAAGVGGIDFSTITETWGPPKSGKSTFLYQTAGEHFLPHYGDDAVLLILDSENSASNIRLKRVFGIRIGNMPDIYPGGDPRVFLEPAFTIEQGVEHVMRYARRVKEQGKFLMVIWDSITTSKPRREYDYINGVLGKDAVDTSDGDTRKDAFGTNMSLNQLRPQIIKWGLNQILGAIYLAPVAVFLVNQATTKLTAVGGTTVASESSGGGYAFKHNIHYSLYFKFVKKIGENPIYFTGTLTRLKIDKSKVIPSLHDIDMHITDEAGGKFMPGMEVVEASKQLGFIGEKNGGWHWVKEEFLPPDAPEELKKNYQKKDLATNQVLIDGLVKMIEINLRKQFQLLEYAYQERDEALALAPPSTPVETPKVKKK